MLTMWSKHRCFTLAENISEIVILQRDSREVSRYGDSRSGVEITLLGVELHTKLNRAFKATGQHKGRGTDDCNGWGFSFRELQ